MLKMKFRLLKTLVWKEALVSIRETNLMVSCPISGALPVIPISDSYQIKSLMEVEKGL